MSARRSKSGCMPRFYYYSLSYCLCHEIMLFRLVRRGIVTDGHCVWRKDEREGRAVCGGNVRMENLSLFVQQVDSGYLTNHYVAALRSIFFTYYVFTICVLSITSRVLTGPAWRSRLFFVPLMYPRYMEFEEKGRGCGYTSSIYFFGRECRREVWVCSETQKHNRRMGSFFASNNVSP